MAVARLSTKKIAVVNKWVKGVHDWFFPPTCIVCGHGAENERDICSCCSQDLPYLGSACSRCALPLSGDGICGQCQKQAHDFDDARAVFLYEAPVDHLIHQLKFGHKLYCARLLGGFMADCFAEGDKPDLLLPVPLHRKRLRERGFNQAIELARPVAKRLDIPLIVDLCQRTQNTPPQLGLTAKERRRNLQNVFSVFKSLDGAHVAVIDDVMTTGTTVDALAKALKQAGAGRVSVWVCARAV